MAVPLPSDLEQIHDYVLALVREGYEDETGQLAARVQCSQLWAKYARLSNHPSALEAYRSCLQILHTAVTVASSLEAQHARLAAEGAFRDSRDVGSNAAAVALDHQQVETAIEFLEQGRGFLFSQLGHFRTPLHDLRARNADLADEFWRLSALLETSTISKDHDQHVDEVGR